MEIVYFVLGIVTVLLVLGVVIIVRVGTLVKELKEEVQFMERGSSDVANDVHRRIDNEVRDLQVQLKDALDFIGDTKDFLHNRIDTEVKDILSMVDSRLDKLENKLTIKK